MKSVFEQQYKDSFTPSQTGEPSPFNQVIDAANKEVKASPSIPPSMPPSADSPSWPETDATVSAPSSADTAHNWDRSAEEHFHSVFPSACRHSRLSTLFPEQLMSDRRWIGWLISFSVGGIAGALAVYLVMSAQPPRIVEKEKIVTKTEIIYRDAPLAGGASLADDEALKSPLNARGARRGRGAGGRRNQATTRAERKQQLLSGLNVGSQSQSAAGSAQSDGAGLSSTQLNQVVSGNRRSLQSCYERELKRGTVSSAKDLKVTFLVKVGTSGIVTGTRVTGEGASVPGLKTCLVGAVQRWVFPPSGQSSEVQFPIVFTPSR